MRLLNLILFYSIALIINCHCMQNQNFFEEDRKRIEHLKAKFSSACEQIKIMDDSNRNKEKLIEYASNLGLLIENLMNLEKERIARLNFLLRNETEDLGTKRKRSES